MDSFAWTSIVTVVAVMLYSYMGISVGGARSKYSVAAPATTGDPNFERHFRVHMNTLEWMPIFIPCLWMTAGFWGDQIAAAVGAVWIVGRVIYMLSYIRDPKSRSLGFGVQGLAAIGLLVASLVGAAQTLINGG